MSEGLFDMQPEEPLRPGDKVVVQTIYGDDAGTVVDVVLEEGFPMVCLDLDSGDRITVNLARCRAL